MILEKDEILSKIKSVKLCMMAHPDNETGSEFEDRISDLEELESQIQNMPFIIIEKEVNCSICNDSCAVITGCSEDGHTIYSECPCVSDKRTLAKQIVTTVNELFHLQETKDWEEKAINEILKYI